MKKYIEATLIQDKLRELCDKYRVAYGNLYGGFGKEIAEITDKVPAADVQEVRHREWRGYTTSTYIGSEDEYGNPRYADRRFYRCSECHYKSVVKSKFCPNCGAKMEE